jgi:hypothetical protein
MISKIAPADWPASPVLSDRTRAFLMKALDGRGDARQMLAIDFPRKL